MIFLFCYVKCVTEQTVYSIFRQTQLVYNLYKNVITGLLVSVSQNHLSGPPVLRTLLVYSCYKSKLMLKYVCIYVWCFHACMGSHLQQFVFTFYATNIDIKNCRSICLWRLKKCIREHLSPTCSVSYTSICVSHIVAVVTGLRGKILSHILLL